MGIKKKIYLDTSTISYLYQKDAPEKMKDTLTFWRDLELGKYHIYISDVTLDEIDRCSNFKKDILYAYLTDIYYHEIDTTEETRILADKIIQAGILTTKSYEDCLHIANASIADCDYIVSWNFKHLVSVRTIAGVRAINVLSGYNPIDICSPNMLIEDE
jgi:predicted nucleic acid-binding protein